ncbi:MAG: SDR family NAD(P)-dependent oxidoreductase [Rickettsiales bacterium]|jgi:short-subunit dehydrogenase|nr:SDR family NAD(P)-dependent oxidoreductase [Rickettsiales bacterium]
MKPYKIIIITGASSGIGKSFANALANRPGIDEIFLISRAKSSIKSATVKITNISADLGGRGGARVISEIIAKLQKTNHRIVIDTLINNAGFGVYGNFADQDPGMVLDMLDINVVAPVAILGAALPHMDRGSRIINVASLAAFAPMGGFAAYAASKAFMLDFTVGIRAELKSRGIKTIALCPGSVDTNFSMVASCGARARVPHGANPDAVAAKCLADLERGRAMSVMKFVWRAKAFMSHLCGKSFLARFTMIFEKRPSTPVVIPA